MSPGPIINMRFGNQSTKDQAVEIAKKAIEELKALGVESVFVFGMNQEQEVWGKVAIDWDMPITRAKEIFDYAYSELLVD